MSENVGSTWRIEEWFPDLADGRSATLKKYFDEFLKSSRTVSLASPKTIPLADVIHFADSILASRLIVKDRPDVHMIYDFGSGAGFPGLVFAILYPKVSVCLVETDVKKSEFLNRMISTLGIKNAKVETTSIETLKLESATVAMTRGLNTISKVIFSSRKSMPKGSCIYHLKGENWAAEVGEIPTQLCSIWTPALAGEYKLPVGPVRFAVVRTDKIA